MEVKFEEVRDSFADVMTKAEWMSRVEVGAFIPSDGDGFWGTETHYSYEYYCFSPAPEGATHVHWYNK